MVLLECSHHIQDMSPTPPHLQYAEIKLHVVHHDTGFLHDPQSKTTVQGDVLHYDGYVLMEVPHRRVAGPQSGSLLDLSSLTVIVRLRNLREWIARKFAGGRSLSGSRCSVLFKVSVLRASWRRLVPFAAAAVPDIFGGLRKS
jgi:hypothetical protein